MPRYLIATDADWVLDEVRSALGGDKVSFVVCRSGKDVTRAVRDHKPDLAVLDLQIGNMGGMAVTMDLRLEESGGRVQHVPVLMLLDRTADVFLAQRCGADGWLIKPLDSLRLRRAATTLLAGGHITEGVPEPTPVAVGAASSAAEPAGAAEPVAG